MEDDLYFSVTSDPAFGEESRMSREEMLRLFPERGGDPERAGKKDPLDCVVWRGERPGEPAWDSPFGRGRPGWHIECTAIALDLLGETFDVQAGGTDLIFPHHEMCANEAQVATGRRFAQVYAHAGMVGLDGEKMSKSRGNLVFVSELRRSEVDPMAIRLTLLRHHYRSDWEWDDAELWTAVDTLAEWRRAFALHAGAPSAPVVDRGARRDGRRPRRPARLRRRRRLGEGDARRQRNGRRQRLPAPPTPSRPSSTPPSASSDRESAQSPGRATALVDAVCRQPRPREPTGVSRCDLRRLGDVALATAPTRPAVVSSARRRGA